MKKTIKNMPSRQRGVAMLSTTLIVLVAMTVMTAIGARVAINNQRIAANSAHSDSAFQAADAGIDNALAYINHNRAYVASADTDGWFNGGSSTVWTACDSSITDIPCGDDTVNLYGSDWVFYGLVPNLQAVSADFGTDVYFLSNNINDVPNNDVDLGCLNLSLDSILPLGLLNEVNGAVNGLLGLVSSLLNPLSVSLLQGVTLGLPTDLCLPLNFNGANRPPPPSSANPTIRAVSYSSNAVDVRGGKASVQQDLQTASLFAWDPMAAIMANGTVNLDGEIQVWGNPRPPSRPPYDWSLLDLNDVSVLGAVDLNVTGLLGGLLDGVLAPLDPVVAPLEAITLAPILNLTVEEVLDLDINATFPLSIWSHDTSTLEPGEILNLDLLGLSPALSGVLRGARTCMPPFTGNATCTIFLSTTIGLEVTIGLPRLFPGLPVIGVTTALPDVPVLLPDVQDEENLLSAVTGLLDTSAPVAFPDDLFDHVFGVPNAEKGLIEEDAVPLADCSDLHNKPAGLYWVSGNCDINGTVGSVTDPLIVVAEGNLTMTAGSEFWGVMYLDGPTARTVTGVSSGVPPRVHGSLVVDASLSGADDFKVIYDRDAIRRAGYRAGSFTRLPGGWTDEVTGP